jgi:excisionase family DNA binding protein
VPPNQVPVGDWCHADQKESAMSDDNLTTPSTLADDEVVMTTRELMEFLSLSRTKIWELTKKEELPATKVGGDYRYVRSEVLAWMERFRVDRS